MARKCLLSYEMSTSTPLSAAVASLEDELLNKPKFKCGDVIVFVESGERRGGMLYSVDQDIYLFLCPSKTKDEYNYYRMTVDELHENRCAAQCVLHVEPYNYTKVIKLLKKCWNSSTTSGTIDFITKVIELHENGWETNWFKRLLRKWKLGKS